MLLPLGATMKSLRIQPKNTEYKVNKIGKAWMTQFGLNYLERMLLCLVDGHCKITSLGSEVVLIQRANLLELWNDHIFLFTSPSQDSHFHNTWEKLLNSLKSSIALFWWISLF